MQTTSEPAPRPPSRADLERFEASFDPRRPTELCGATVAGFGEISMVFRLDACPAWVVKRVAGLAEGEIDGYARAVVEYASCLEARGVGPEPVHIHEVGGGIVYLVQRALDPAAFGHRVLRDGSDAALARLVAAVLDRVERALSPNTRVVGAPSMGLDAQLSNWAFAGGALRYLDLTTPMMRDGLDERLNVGFLLRSLPLPLRLAMRAGNMVKSMLDRYYAPRTVALDMVANFIKEGRADRVPLGVDGVNRWLRRVDAGARPLDAREVHDDYRADARMWAAMQWVKRPDRWVRTHVLGQDYPYVIPPAIDRRMGRTAS